jgi:hypothetical protein
MRCNRTWARSDGPVLVQIRSARPRSKVNLGDLAGESEIPSSGQRTVTASPVVPNRELVFSNPMGELDSHQGGPCAGKAFEAQHGRDFSLDGSVVLLDDIVKVLTRSDDHSTPRGVSPAKKSKRAVRGRVAIDSDLPWRLSVVRSLRRKCYEKANSGRGAASLSGQLLI